MANARSKPVERSLICELFTHHWNYDFDLLEGSAAAQPVPFPQLPLEAGKLPEYRGRGIASQRIQAAERQVLGCAVQESLALAEVPQLYCKLNWKTLSAKKGEFVVAKSIVSQASQPVR